MLIDRMVAIRAEMAGLEAQLLTAMHDLAELRAAGDPSTDPDAGPDEFVVDEIALALVTTRARVAEQLRFAAELSTRLRATRDLLAAGRIDGYQAWLIYDSSCRLVDPANVPAVEAAILPQAPEMTGPQLRRRLARLITDAEPAAFAERHASAMRDRCVRLNTTDADNCMDAMGTLWLRHAAADIAAIDARLNQLANSPQTSRAAHGDPRSRDNLRADLVRDLLMGHPLPGSASRLIQDRENGAGSPGPNSADPAADAPGRASARGPGHRGPAAQVIVAVPIQTLMGIDDTPGELVGHGPIPAPVARKIAADPGSTWRRMLTDPAGNMLDLSTTRYRPGRLLDLAVTVRDQTSRFPRSTAPAARGDFDHTIPHPTGPTSFANGGKLIRRDHRLKHTPGWRVSQPDPGVFDWLTPTGHRYRSRPVPQPRGRWPEPWQLDPHPGHAQDVIHLPGPPDTG